ncbi:MAG TPA: bifunctional DNA primase/polymerase [Trebonia sp.]|nr:bifunctional DNA primase/polymerase [Trebonia sp.]
MTVTRHLFEGMTSGVSVAGVGRAEPGPLWSALGAADLGWHVFPCAPRAKRPALRENWQDLATTDADRIRSWWAHQPYNVGIACGQSGLVVIDLDVAHDGRAGLDGPVSGTDALERLCRAHGQRYPGGTYSVETPSGGTHLYFTAPTTPVRNSAGRLGPLIDVRADGGYVVGDGSRIGGRAYTARGGVLPLALPLPGWVARLLTEEPALPETARPLPVLDRAQGRAYALAAFREETRRVAQARVGTRNDTLNRAAFSLGRLVTAGLIPPLPVMTGLADAAAHAGLPEDEARRTIRLGMAAGARKPRPSAN